MPSWASPLATLIAPSRILTSSPAASRETSVTASQPIQTERVGLGSRSSGTTAIRMWSGSPATMPAVAMISTSSTVYTPYLTQQSRGEGAVVVGEHRPRLVEPQPPPPLGPVPMLGHDRHRRLPRYLVEEHDHIGGLLQLPRLPQVLQLRPLPVG